MNAQDHPPEFRSRGIMLARFGARFSFIAPFAAYIIYIITQQCRALSEAQTGFLHIVGLALGISILALPVLGFISGIAALVSTKHYGREGIFGWAIAGTLLCGLCLFLVVLIVIVAQHYYARHAA